MLHCYFGLWKATLDQPPQRALYQCNRALQVHRFSPSIQIRCRTAINPTPVIPCRAILYAQLRRLLLNN